MEQFENIQVNSRHSLTSKDFRSLELFNNNSKKSQKRMNASGKFYHHQNSNEGILSGRSSGSLGEIFEEEKVQIASKESRQLSQRAY